MSNLSCIFYAPGSVRFENRETPDIRDDHDVIVRIAYVGVCGSDVHFWKDGSVAKCAEPAKGMTMGHEATGTIHAIGKSVTRVKVGDKVAIEPGVPCRRCSFCKDGFYNLCKSMRFAADPPNPYGTLTQFFLVPEDFVYTIPDGISLAQAVLIEPLSVAVHANRIADVRYGDKVAVMGTGTVGLLCGIVARIYGAREVVLIDVLAAKLNFAQKHFGFRTFQPSPGGLSHENATSIKGVCGAEDGVDVVIEASGAPSAIQTGIYSLRSHGTYVQTGFGRPNVEIPITVLAQRELAVRGCFRYGSGDFDLAISMLARGLIDLGPLITSISAFEDTVEAWEKTARGDGVKNLIQVQEGL